MENQSKHFDEEESSDGEKIEFQEFNPQNVDALQNENFKKNEKQEKHLQNEFISENKDTDERKLIEDKSQHGKILER